MDKAFTLCADDYALSGNSMSAILNLLSKGRLSAVSCVVNTPFWHKGSQALRTHKQLDVGLHFNLTEGYWLSQASKSLPGLRTLIMKAYWGNLSEDIIAAELMAQLQAFSDCLGRAPDFIDGHQHIQQLPVIRDVIIDYVLGLPREERPYLRSSYLQKTDGNHAGKRWLINHLGAKKFKQLLEEHGLVHNACFSGVYDFSPKADYPALFRGFLTELTEGGLIMCHPSLNDGSKKNHAIAREKEFAYLNSETFIKDCRELGLILTPGKQLFVAAPST